MPTPSGSVRKTATSVKRPRSSVKKTIQYRRQWKI